MALVILVACGHLVARGHLGSVRVTLVAQDHLGGLEPSLHLVATLVACGHLGGLRVTLVAWSHLITLWSLWWHMVTSVV